MAETMKLFTLPTLRSTILPLGVRRPVPLSRRSICPHSPRGIWIAQLLALLPVVCHHPNYDNFHAIVLNNLIKYDNHHDLCADDYHTIPFHFLQSMSDILHQVGFPFLCVLRSNLIFVADAVFEAPPALSTYSTGQLMSRTRTHPLMSMHTSITPCKSFNHYYILLPHNVGNYGDQFFRCGTDRFHHCIGDYGCHFVSYDTVTDSDSVI